MASDIIKMDVILERQRVGEIVPGYDAPKDHSKLVAGVANELDLHTETGGWMWKITDRQDGSVRLLGRFIRAGESVVA